MAGASRPRAYVGNFTKARRMIRIISTSHDNPRARCRPIARPPRPGSVRRRDRAEPARVATKESTMDLGIEGKTALVCAASRAGRGCAEALAAEGVNLVIVARTRDTLEETAEEIRAGANVSVTAVACDITTPDGRAAALAACPQPDILVTNAGARRPATSATSRTTTGSARSKRTC